ncbi:MAG: DUF2339 domain-containing protein [bacterium]
MFEFILIIAAFFILLTKIYKVEDRINKLEKKQPLGQVIAPTSAISQPVVMNTTQNVAPLVEVVTQPVASKPVQTSADKEEYWGKILGIAGVIAVIVGVSFFLSYAFVNNLIGVTGRVMIGIIAGIICISVGQALRAKYRSYSNILIGCGIGLLYLTTFASFAFYSLISSPVAYGLLIGVTALSVVLSVIDNAMVLATIGVIGGFLTPIFMTLSNASLSQVLTYVLILDFGVMITAYLYKWRKLAVVSFIGTWVMVFMTFVNLYNKDDKLTMCFYLSLYFIIFLLSSVFHNVVRKEKSDAGDLGMVVINALSYTAIIYSLLYDTLKNSMGFFMVVMALLYFAVAYWSFTTNKENKLLNMFLPAMSALFLTLAIPAQFHGPWISLAWFVEAIILYALDYSLKGKNLYAYGAVVFIVSALYTFAQYSDALVRADSFVFIWNERFFIFVAGIVTAYVLAYFIRRTMRDNVDLTESIKKLASIYFFIAQIATLFIMTSEISQLYSQRVYAETTSINAEISQIQQNYYAQNSYGNSTNSPVMTGGDNQDYQSEVQLKYNELSTLSTKNANERNTTIDIVWIVYAMLSIGIGFAFKSRAWRSTGLILMAATAFKIFIDVWALGALYRIVTSLVFGVLALVASFVYAKYKDKLKSTLTTTMMLLLAFGLAGGVVEPQVASAETDKSIIQTESYRAEITSGSIIQGRPTRFVVPADVEEKTNMTDLRIFTGIGNQVPYTLNYSGYGGGAEPEVLNVKNLSERSGHLEFLLDNKKGPIATHNGLTFSISNDGSAENGSPASFRYVVQVYGSDMDLPPDSGDWRRLSLGDSTIEHPQYIFNFYDTATGQSVSNASIAYEPSSAKYLKVVLLPLDKDASSGVTFNNKLLNFKPKNVSLSGFTTQSALTAGLNSSSISKDVKVTENTDTKSTEIYVDFPGKGSITNAVYLNSSSGTDFYRHVVVQARNDVVVDDKSFYPEYVTPRADGWQTVGDGVIYSFTKGEGIKLENLAVNYRITKASHYRILISNQDNPPVALGSNVVFSSPSAVVTFIPHSSGPFYLYFGGDLNSPVYDLDAVLSNNSLTPRDISTINVSGVLSNPEYKQAVTTIPFTEKYPWILNGVLVLLVIFIAGLIVTYVRKIKRSN